MTLEPQISLDKLFPCLGVALPDLDKKRVFFFIG